MQRMTLADVTRLIDLVEAMNPVQKMTDATPDAWLLPLGHLPFDLAQQGLVEAFKSVQYVGPSDIITGVGVVLRERAKARVAALEADPSLLPDADPDDVHGTIQAIREGRYRRPRPSAVTHGRHVEKIVSGLASEPGARQVQTLGALGAALIRRAEIVDAEIVEEP